MGKLVGSEHVCLVPLLVDAQNVTQVLLENRDAQGVIVCASSYVNVKGSLPIAKIVLGAGFILQQRRCSISIAQTCSDNEGVHEAAGEGAAARSLSRLPPAACTHLQRHLDLDVDLNAYFVHVCNTMRGSIQRMSESSYRL